jgi:hypothetical protein
MANISAVIEAVRNAGERLDFDAITPVGLLLERATFDRYGDPIYERAYMPDGWLELRPNPAELDALVDALIELLDKVPRMAASAAWALGKAKSDRAVPHLVSALERCWKVDDETAYQLLLALHDHGLQGAGDLVRQIARDGLEESREFAVSLLPILDR